MHFSMDMAIVASDLNYHIIYFNPFAEKIYELKAEKAIGKTIMDLFVKESADQSHIEEALAKVKKGKDFRVVSNRVKRGKTRFIESVVSGIRDLKKQLVGFVIMSRDITRRKLADEALQNSEKKYRNFVDNALVGIFQINVKGDVLFVNDAFLRILEFESQEEAMAGGITRRFTKPEKMAALMEILREKGKIDNFETAMQTRTGKTINLLLSATMESDVISGVIIDITRVKNLEEQLHQSQKMEALGTLTGGIAHEFNNILMVITTWGTLLQLEINSDNPLREHIDIIVDAVRNTENHTGKLQQASSSLTVQ
jgi:PAS domain S-box-containing protein